MAAARSVWRSGILRHVHTHHHRIPASHRKLSTSRQTYQENTYFPRNGRQSQSQPPVVVVQTDPSSSNPRRPQNLRYFFFGLASFPVLYLAYKSFTYLRTSELNLNFATTEAATPGSTSFPTLASTLGLGSSPPPPPAPSPDYNSELASAYAANAKLREDEDFWYHVALDSDLHAIRYQRLLIDLVTSSKTSSTAYTAILDTDLLQRSPIPIPSDAPFLRSPAHAQLIRLVDSRGRNRALILALDAPPSAVRVDEDGDPLGPNEAAWRFMYRLAEELYYAGANALPDMPVMVWERRVIVENSVVASKPRVLYPRAGDMPVGFPMRQVRAIKARSVPNDLTPRAEFGGNVLDGRDGIMLEQEDEDEDDDE